MNLWHRIQQSAAPKSPYIWAIISCLLIPVVVMGDGAIASLIDPEMARGNDDYSRNYQLLQLLRAAVGMSMAGLAGVLWLAVFWFILKSRQRSLRWMLLAALGPLGLIGVTLLGDKAPEPGDRYQAFIQRLQLYWRIPLEIALFYGVSSLAYGLVVLQRDLMIQFQSAMTGTPVATIIDVQNASSGMWAFGEFLEEMVLVVLMYLFWPILFNLAGNLLAARNTQRA